MGRTGSWKVRLVVLLPGCCFLGCLTSHGTALSNAKLDPWVEEIAKQPLLGKTDQTATLNPEIILREIPLHTPLAEARAIMERHGFSCWAKVPDGSRECLHCTAYKYKYEGYADRIVVKLFYENRKIVNAEVTVDYEVRRMDRLSLFSGP